MRVLAVTTMRNEAAFVLEWLAHHRAIGITDFLIFTNDCDDGTDRMLDRLQELGLVQHIRNQPPFPEGPQWAALKQADTHPLRAAADWIVVLDIDEFVNIRTGDHRLASLLAALPEADAITMTWRLFGNGGAIRFEDRPVTENFTQAAPAVLYWPWRAAMFKTLFRNDGTYSKLGVHRPRSPRPERAETVRWFDGSGRELGASFRTRRIYSDFGRDNYALVQLNHYALGAMESFVLKADRGRANRQNGPFDMDYWVERNFCQIADPSINEMRTPREAIRAELFADPILSRLHNAAVDWRRARFQILMREERWRALFARLMMTPPTRALTAAEATILREFAQVATATETPDRGNC